MGELAVEFYKMLKTAHRIYGQYKRIAGFQSFYGVSSFEELTGYEVPKRITRGSIRRLEEYVEEMRKKKEHFEYVMNKGGWEEALFVSWDVFKDSYEEARSNSLKTELGDYAKSGMDRLFDAVKEFGYRYAIEKWRSEFRKMKNAKKRLEKEAEYKHSIESFLVNRGEELKRLAYSVVDTKTGGFNTNTKWWKRTSSGAAGRSKFRKFIDDMFKAWWIKEQAQYVKHLAR